jgi:hypothetical protein
MTRCSLPRRPLRWDAEENLTGADRHRKAAGVETPVTVFLIVTLTVRGPVEL